MKEIKDKIVMSDAYYFVLAYLNATDFHPVIGRGVCEYDKMTGRPIFKMDMLYYTTFVELFQEGMDWMLSKSLPISLDNIAKLN